VSSCDILVVGEPRGGEPYDRSWCYDDQMRERGEPVPGAAQAEIGTIQNLRQDALRSAPTSHVFVSYVSEDLAAARRIAAELEEIEVEVWLDQTRLKPGMRWKDEIRRAIGDGAAFLAFFSPVSEERDRSYMREEIVLACEELRMRPRPRAWFIPLLLDGVSEAPDIPIGGGETLRDLHYVDLHGDWLAGMRQLVAVLRPVDEVVDRLVRRSQSEDLTQAEGLSLLDRAVTLSPRRRDVRRERARILIASGDYERATEDYEETAPEYPAERAWTYWLAGDHDSAITAYKRLRKHGSASAQDQFDLGCLLYGAGRFKEALECFLDSADAASHVFAPRQAALRLFTRCGDLARVAKVADDAEAAFGEHADICEARALTMLLFRFSGLGSGGSGSNELATYDYSFVVQELARGCRLDQSPKRLFRAAVIFQGLRDFRNSGGAAAAGLKFMPESRSLKGVLAQAAEYGPEEVTKNWPDVARLYAEAVEADRDDLGFDDEMPLFDGDDRFPRPVVITHETVALTLSNSLH
jgi:tetratricopeptide (TPR) repeat protein